jgi:transposase InsO family protein
MHLLTQRYEKQLPGHQIQVDVKFLNFIRTGGKKIRPFQYAAADDLTRIRALKIYSRHTQGNAIRFIDYVVSKFPFQIHTIRTDNGHEFQPKFHWHVEDLGIRRIYDRLRSSTLNGKVERSHATDDMNSFRYI